MAERMVILRFPDADAAQAFVMNPHLPDQLGYSPYAMFVMPMVFCECPDKQRQNVKNWARGRRTGLWLCVKCKRPSKYHREGVMDRLTRIFGYNQLGAS